MSRRVIAVFKVALSLTLVGIFAVNAIAASVPRMTKEELRPLLGNADVVIGDVRAGRDWKSSAYKIPGAVRLDPAASNQWTGKFDKDATLVLYCA